MNYLETLLSPIVWSMHWLLNFYNSILSSTGLAILLVSFSFALILLPIQKIARRTEQRISAKMALMDAGVKSLKRSLKGEALFNATEKLYQENNYHPIHSIGIGAGFFVMLPVLISAILLFTNSSLLSDQSFAFIDDLSKADGLLGPVNVLPILMTVITLIDAKIRFRDDKRSRGRFLFISLVLLVIVYSLPAGLVLYWTGNNIMSLFLNLFQQRQLNDLVDR